MAGFAQATAVHGGQADLDPQWTVGGKPNGGYLLADSLVDRVCAVWDSADRVVAQATQLAGYRMAANSRAPHLAYGARPGEEVTA